MRNRTRRETFRKLPIYLKILLVFVTPVAIIWICVWNIATVIHSVAYFWMRNGSDL